MTIDSHKDGNKQTFGTPNHEIYQSNNIYMSNKIESKLNKSDKLSKYSIYIRH